MASAKVYKSHLIRIFQHICTCKGNTDTSLTSLGSTPLKFYMLRFRMALVFLSSQWTLGGILWAMTQHG